ncbi:DUF6968 family protein [Sorangium cellulosum]|uniref:DUF6968 family protein n=1 Tax=Sorangium cellulosum TaxID=56 RepID=UPI001331ABC9|nr:hypothetical protein [Sorangium cellulosum]
MEDIVAERELVFRESGSELDQPVVVRLGRPHLGEHAPNYTIYYEIQGPGDALYTYFAAGVDSMQALVLVFVAVNAHLDRLKQGGRLSWLDAEDLGFPTGC